MKRFLIETAKILLIALLVAWPLKHVFQAFKVQGASMEGILQDKDRLLVDELSYRFRNPERGDIIVFRAPNDPTQFYVKRVIGLPGETVEIQNNEVRIATQKNPTGFLLDESTYLK